MPNTSGLVNRRNVIATSDATVVSRLKQAGAIPLGVTNCSELCMWYESSNRVYGRTNNPYDLQRIVGGSSGEPRHLSTVLHNPGGLCSPAGPPTWLMPGGSHPTCFQRETATVRCSRFAG